MPMTTPLQFHALIGIRIGLFFSPTSRMESLRALFVTRNRTPSFSTAFTTCPIVRTALPKSFSTNGMRLCWDVPLAAYAPLDGSFPPSYSTAIREELKNLSRRASSRGMMCQRDAEGRRKGRLREGDTWQQQQKGSAFA